jgi:hypothetical protein
MEALKPTIANVESLKLTLANGALLEAPIYEKHFRGSNWLAVIDIDATAPAGLARRFLDRGRGDCLYNTEQIGLFDAVEFAADYTTSVGTKKRERWYGVVTAKTDDYLMVERCPSGAKAVLHSKKLRTSPEALVAALEQDHESLIARAVKIAQQISELKKVPAGVFGDGALSEGATDAVHDESLGH